MLEPFVSDLRSACRSFRKNPGSTTAVVLTLALGIGVNATVFTLTNAVFFKRVPFVDQNERVLYVERPDVGLSFADLEEWRARATSLEGVAGATAWLASLSDPTGIAERCAVTLISPNGFALIRQQPVLGRNFQPSDAAPGAAAVAILSDALWERRYGRDPNIIGRTVRLELSETSVLQQDSVTVVGVMAPNFSFPLDQDLWMPLRPPRSPLSQEVRNITFLFGRVADKVSVQRARAELEAIGRQVQRSDEAGSQRPFSVQDFSEHFIGPTAALTFASMLGAVSFVLLIACANVANLMLVQAINSSRDISVRLALGAGRWRIARQMIVESVLLSAAGGILGWALARVGVRAYELSGYAPFNYPHYIDFAMDSRVFWYLAAVSIGTGLLFGLAPASRLPRLDINAVLRASSHRTTDGRRGRRLRTLLVVTEMALAIVLLAGAGVMIRSLLNIYSTETGVDTRRLVFADVGLPPIRYPDAAAQIAFYEHLEEKLELLPGVESATIANRYPTQGARRVPYETARQLEVDKQHRPTVPTVVIGPGYFKAMGARVLAGREFTNADGASAAPSVLVNEQFASQSWPGESALGKQIRLFDADEAARWRTVVGVVSNVVQHDIARQETAALVYVPYRQSPGPFMYVFVRGRVPSERLGGMFQNELQALDATLAVSPQPLAARMHRHYQDRELYVAVLVIFAGCGLVLASLGLYAVVASIVAQRTQEIGVRTALGATSRDVFFFVLTQGIRPVALGVPIGLAVSFVVNRVLESQLVQVAPSDPIALAAATGVLIVCAVLGCTMPVRRALRVDPIVALRHE